MFCSGNRTLFRRLCLPYKQPKRHRHKKRQPLIFQWWVIKCEKKWFKKLSIFSIRNATIKILYRKYVKYCNKPRLKANALFVF